MDRIGRTIKPKILKAIAHPVRLMILEELSKGTKCVTEVEELLGTVRQPNISQHLAILRQCGLVGYRQEGRRHCYFITNLRMVSELLATIGAANEAWRATNNMTEKAALIEGKTRGVLRGIHRKRGNLVPILQRIQASFGYLPREAMLEVSRFLGIPEVDVYSVASFYNQFRLTPPGKHRVRVCLGTACHMKGGHIILEAWQRRLGIKPGEVTPDREFELDTVACVGCCAMAPVNVVDDKVEGKVSPTRVDGILLSYRLQKEREGKGQ